LKRWDCCEIKNKKSALLKNAISQSFFEKKIGGIEALHQGCWLKKIRGQGMFQKSQNLFFYD